MVRRSSLTSLFLLAACAAPPASDEASRPNDAPAPAPTETPADKDKPAGSEATIVGATQDGVAVVRRGPSLVAINLATKAETVLSKTSTGLAVADDVVAFIADGKLATYRKDRGIVASAIAATPGERDCTLDVASAGGRTFVSSCAPGASSPALRAIDRDATAITIHEGVKRPWAVSDDGARVFVIASDGQAAVHTVPANAITPIDRDVTWGRFGRRGTDVLYRTTASDLRRAPTTAPVQPVTLIETGVAAVDALSPDTRWMLASASPPENGRHDVRLTPVPPGMPFIPTPTVPVDLVLTPTGLSLGFTADGKQAAYLADLTLHVRTASDVDARDVAVARDVVSAHVIAGTSDVIFATRASNDAVDVSVVDATNGKVTALVEGASPSYATAAGTLVFTKRGAAAIETKSVR